MLAVVYPGERNRPWRTDDVVTYGGMVSVVMTCRHDVKRVSIDDSLLGDDKDMLEDLIAAAVNDAVRQVEKTTQEKMAGMTQGLNLPGGVYWRQRSVRY